MPSRHRILRGSLWAVSALCWSATFFFANLALPAYLRHSNKEHYYDAVFNVTGAGVTGRYGSQPYLEGTVNGSREIYIDTTTPAITLPDHQNISPVGTQIPVKYNTGMTRMKLQYQSLRVVPLAWNFTEDARFVQYFLVYFAMPSAFLGAMLYFTRSKTQ